MVLLCWVPFSMVAAGEEEAVSIQSGDIRSEWVGRGEWRYLAIDASARDISLEVSVTEPSTDLDLYVKWGALPTATDYDCISENLALAAEQCLLPNQGEGTWYIGVTGWFGFPETFTVAATLQNAEGLHADLALGWSLSANPAVVGTPVALLLEVTNRGPDISRGTTLIAALPAHATLLNVAPRGDGICTVETATVRCTFGGVTVDDTVGATLVLRPENTETLPFELSLEAGLVVDPTPDDASITVEIPVIEPATTTDWAPPSSQGRAVLGSRHAALLMPDGTVQVWGRNAHGQLGDGTLIHRNTPQPVAELRNIVSLGSGYQSLFAVQDDGSLWSWGFNFNGQLGDDTTDNRRTPFHLPDLDEVTAVASGDGHTVVLLRDGTLQAWGLNDEGELGDGTTDSHGKPAPVADLENITALSVGAWHTLALKSDGTVWSWGYNDNGQLGDGTTENRLTPIPVSGLETVVAVAAGAAHSIALDAEGAVWIWGSNFRGQLGDGTTTDRGVPYRLPDITASAIAAGLYHTVIRNLDGLVWGWGWNKYGQLGDGTLVNRLHPVPTFGLASASAIAAGEFTSMALMADGSVRIWGTNDMGQLGVGHWTDSRVPVSVIGSERGEAMNWWRDTVRDRPMVISANVSHSMALATDGTVWTWGENRAGTLGDGTSEDRYRPLAVPNLGDVTTVTAGYYHAHAVTRTGRVLNWGSNAFGQLGDGTSETRFIPVEAELAPDLPLTPPPAIQVAAGYDFALALTQTGQVWSWGGNEKGQLGDGTGVARLSPVSIVGLEGVVAVDAGFSHAVALDGSGQVWNWGRNHLNQLGQGNRENRFSPVQVPGLPHIIAVAAGANHTLALSTNGEVWAWGDLSNGQAGVDGETSRTTPVRVAGLPEQVVAIDAGAEYGAVLTQAGEVWTWGGNNYGQLGHGNFTDTPTPTRVTGLPTSIAIASGYWHMLALAPDGTLWSWGFNGNGELGRIRDGDSAPTPGQVDAPAGSGPLYLTAASVPSGLYASPQALTLRCGAGGGCAAIHYTVDGTPPTRHSAPFDQPIQVASNTEVSFFSVEANGVGTPVQTLSYTIDADAPTVTITQPQDDPDAINAQDAVFQITGQAADVGTGLTGIRVRVDDGEHHLALAEQGTLLSFGQTPTWLDAPFDPDTGTWSLDTSLVHWTEGTLYTIRAMATDRAGNTTEQVGRFFFFSGPQAYTTLSLQLSSQSILQDETLTVAGKLTRLPDSGADLSAQPITLTITAPDGDTRTVSTSTYDPFGHFILEDLTGFTTKGHHAMEATFAGNAMLAQTQVADGVLVGASAGYAIIVEGKLNNNEGLDSHNKTTNRIYQHFLDRGFRPEDIRYFNYDATQDGIHASPTKEGVQAAIQTWALEKMNDVAAPLYLVMVDHGQIDTFFLNRETVTPSELNDWVTELEAELDTEALAEKRIIILGACYSGSFVPALSADNRVIIASAAADEVSFKGPLEPDNIRVGEFFLEALFQKLGRGSSLKEAFQQATTATALFTRRGGGQGGGFANAVNRYLDTAMQHPLLDDNGDGRGSNTLADGGDGVQAATLFLGTGLTHTAANPADIVAVTAPLYLTHEQNMAALWAQTRNNEQVAVAWVEVRTPSKILATQGSTNQVAIELEKGLMTYNAHHDAWSIHQAGFHEPGKYEIFYFAKDVERGEITPMRRSVVYKRVENNQPPAAFALISPLDNAQTKSVLTFDWEATHDPDGLVVTYRLVIAEDEAFEQIVYRSPHELTASSALVDQEADLHDLTTYYWRVEAIDAFGEVTLSETRLFETDNTNGLDGLLQGIVFSDRDFSRIAGAIISVGTQTVRTERDGSFVLPVAPGRITLSVTHDDDGHDTETQVDTRAGETVSLHVALHVAGTAGDPSAADANAGTSTDADAPSAAPSADLRPALDVDGNGLINATDGILILRRLNGGSTIDTGVLLPSGTHNGSVVATIDQAAARFDVDGSGNVNATDGVLIMRRLNGGSTIDTGVVLPHGQHNAGVVATIDALRRAR